MGNDQAELVRQLDALEAHLAKANSMVSVENAIAELVAWAYGVQRLLRGSL